MANSKDNISKYATGFIGFDEVSGNVYDSIGGYTGTLSTAPPVRDIGWNGKGKSMYFDGTARRYVYFSPYVVFPVGTKSIRFKVKFYGNNAHQVIMTTKEVTSGTEEGFSIYIGEKSNLCVKKVMNGQLHEIIGTKNLDDSHWHDILFTYEEKENGTCEMSYKIDDDLEGTLLFTNKETKKETYPLLIGTNHMYENYHFKGWVDEIEIYDKVISPVPDKHLILHSGQYKYHDGTSWQTTTATEANFIQYGMDDLSHITEAQWVELVGDKSISVWSDFEDKKYVDVVLEKEPFTAKEIIGDDAELITYTTSAADQLVIATETNDYSVYDHISETPTAVIYTEATDDITITTTTNPYTLYDEFDDTVDVLYYTDDEAVTEADLTIEANWSPLDELQGDAELVTWTDEENAERVLVTEGLLPAQIVKLQDWVNVEKLVSIGVTSTGEHAPFIIERQDEQGAYYSYYEGHFFKIEPSENMISNYGLTPVKINSITKQEWRDFLGSEKFIRFVYLFSNQSIGTVSASATLDVEHTVGTIIIAREIIATTPEVSKLELTVSSFSAAGRLEELERINLNNLLELELRTSILMKMPFLKSKEMIVETFDDNEYEIPQTIKNMVEVPSEELDEFGNPLPSSWIEEILTKPSDFNLTVRQYQNEFQMEMPITVSEGSTKMIMQKAGEDIAMLLTDGTHAIVLTNLYDTEIDLSLYDLSLLKLKVEGQTNSWFKGIAYAWS